ncbi:hypothetical protein JOC34_002993 [Virgibacillus halotolerans]|nr:hypothetical protein [Virgibacillus halotolerans]
MPLCKGGGGTNYRVTHVVKTIYSRGKYIEKAQSFYIVWFSFNHAARC